MISLNHNISNGMKFLLIEPNPYSRFLVRTELERNFTIKWLDVASNGTEGMELARRRKYDVAIIDYNLPDDDGLSVWIKLKRISFTPPSILTITDIDEEQSLLDLRSERFDYVVKSGQYPSNLPDAIRRLLNGYNNEPYKLEVKVKVSEKGIIDALTKISYVVNQEIKDPLTSIIGSTQLLLKGNYDLDYKSREKVSIIEENAHRIREILFRLNCIIDSTPEQKQCPVISPDLQIGEGSGKSITLVRNERIYSDDRSKNKTPAIS